MARIAPKPQSEYPLWVRLVFFGQRRTYGKIFEPLFLWGRAPKLLRHFLAFYRAVDRKSSPLEESLRSLICVRVSQINDCPFCVDLNSFISQKRAVETEKLLELPDFKTSPRYSERERVALAFTEVVTTSGQKVSDELFSRLRERFSEDEIIELTALIAFQNLSSKFNTALGATAPGLCSLPASGQQNATVTPRSSSFG